MLGLTGSELGLVSFIVVAILTARHWPRLGERLALAFYREPPTPERRSDEHP